MLMSVYFGIKGCLYTFIASGQLPYCREFLNQEGSAYQSFGMIASIPWAMKALFGAISDSLPVNGYFKKWYIVLSAVLGTVGVALIAGLQLTSLKLIAAALFFAVNAEIAIIDLLCEGRYAELMAKHPQTGSDLISFVWGCVQLGGLLASFLVGPLSDAGYIKEMFWLCVPLAAQVLVPTLLNFLAEEQLPAQLRGLQVEKIAKHKHIFILACLLAFAALGLALVTLFLSTRAVLSYSIISAAVLCFLSFKILPSLLAKCNFYMFIISTLYVQITGAVDYFYVSNSDCVKGGPSFGYTYYTTYSTIVQNLFGWVGVIIFQTFLSQWAYRSIFWLSMLLKIAGGMVDLIIVKRWNKALGISDKLMYMLGYNVVYRVVMMFDFLAGVVLTSKLCPKNLESTVYALLAGFQNYGNSLSRSLGIFFIDLLHIRTVSPCNFDNLPGLIILCHVLLPLLSLPLAFLLIPKATLTDCLLAEDDEIEQSTDSLLDQRENVCSGSTGSCQELNETKLSNEENKNFIDY
ncbi:uncharacterized protein LOC135145155 [Zophobas morio]|uniref:uncharacterized protein LOC135145155 n=1 Tax=Zophobas morio TaxID=2755281 RepID=UPI0030836A2D